MSEFTIIKKFFKKSTHPDSTVKIGIGDDAAVIAIPADQHLVTCVDTLVQGVHFLPDTPPAAIGHQALAVNLSDMAAMGATPHWFTLALTLPHADEQWLSEFSQGLFALANAHNMTLVGGDTTQGPLTITVQVLGLVPPDRAILRSGAKAGDKIYVTGSIGDAACGLAMLQNRVNIKEAQQAAYLRRRYQYAEPRVAVGERLCGLATSAIDISDGLAADLQHILAASLVGARIYAKKLPLFAAGSQISPEQAVSFALTGGDDYELCFTVQAERQVEVEQIVKTCHIPCTCIGEITTEVGLMIIGLDDEPLHLESLGWEHFSKRST